MSDAPGVPPIEGFALETERGLIFTVKGMVHPPDRVVAYLRYVPDPSGERERERMRYRRVYTFSEQLEALRADGSDVLVDDPMFGTQLQAVPVAEVARVYDPRLRLASLRERGPADSLEEAALQLAELLSSSADVDESALGITGSLLFGLHAASSDLDLVVYGRGQGRRVRAALADLLNGSATPVRRPRGEELAAIHAVHRSETPLSPEDFAEAQARKVNEGWFGARPFFIRFVKLPSETEERYGDPRYESCGPVTLVARVDDDTDSLFTPCSYGVTDVRFVEGASVDDVRSVVSFRGRFSDQAREGETVMARGALERVISPGTSGWFRLVVGGQAGDYLVRHPG